jgi:uncharacterized membrane protein YgcG/DNA-directed RNA polymerase specialized sigma24 family protein
MSATVTADRSASIQQATREFAGVYERNAYLVYNLALRIALDADAAIDAAQAAFLACMSSPDPDADLPEVTVRRALSSARHSPSLQAAGEAEAQAMLSANAELVGTERAAIALIGLGGSGAPEVARVLDMPSDAAQGLIARAWAAFAAAARIEPAGAEEAYREWLWAEPPARLWERLYPSFYEQFVKRLSLVEEARPGAAAPVLAAVAEAAPRPGRRERRAARRAERDARRERPMGRVRRIARAITIGRIATLLAVVGAGAGVAYATGLVGAVHTGPFTRITATQPTHKLSPAQIALLRKEQLAASLAYAAQQKDISKQASLAARLEAQAIRQQRKRQLALQAAAARQQQQAAVKRGKQLAARQKALQAQLLAQQRLQQPALQRQATTPAPASTRNGSGTGAGSGSANGSGKHRSGAGNGSSGSGSGSGGPTPSQAQQQCLYDANNGTYVCPQG